MNTCTITHRGRIATLTLQRPTVHNALDAAMIADLLAAFTQLASDDSAQVVVLTGAGASFCAGTDMAWMGASSADDRAANAEHLAALFDAAWNLPKPLIGRVNGAAIGSGAGLVACCDIVAASDTAVIGFSEVKLGLVPAVVAQYVVPKIGVSQARALFVSGERFTAERAFDIGLVHAVTPADDLDATVASLARRMLGGSPTSIASTKHVIDEVWRLQQAEARRYVVDALVAARQSADGQEGVRAFLEKRRPAWPGWDRRRAE